jgi:hypothetical protein
MSKALLNVVVLMAGRGERFLDAGYEEPKWAIAEPKSGLSLLALSVGGLSRAVSRESYWAFVAQRVDLERSSLSRALSGIAELDQAKTIGLDAMHCGPLATFAAAAPELDLDLNVPLVLQVCDSYFPISQADLACNPDADGLVYCFEYDAPNLCHVELQKHNDDVSRMYEKIGPTLKISSSGAFLFRSPSHLMNYVHKVLEIRLQTVSTEYHISDVVNSMIADGKKFKARVISGASALGTPRELSDFKASGLCFPR